MYFDRITSDGRLWSVVYEGKETNALDELFEQWSNPVWLRSFFEVNMSDLISYFKVTDVNTAIYDTMDDNEQLQCLILDISPEADLEALFRPLENNRMHEIVLGREKAKIRNRPCHASWLRLYAIKLDSGIYIVTGGAIKLTATMAERQHTIDELGKLEQVRNLLLSEGIVDADGFNDFVQQQ